MAGPNLPVNIDTTYADSGTDATVKTHQQHHDSIHGIVNKFDTGLGTASNGNVLAWNGTVYAPATPSGTSTIPRPIALVVAANDSPTSFKTNADYQCDGTADQVEINAAIAAVQPGAGTIGTGGTVRLAPGTYNVTGPVRVKSLVSLEGSGHFASVLRVTTSTTVWASSIGDGATTGGIIEPFAVSTQGSRVENLYLYGNGVSVHGVYTFSDFSGTSLGHSDTVQYYRTLLIRDTLDGIKMPQGRGNQFHDIRMIAPRGYGVNVDGDDSFWDGIDIGSATLAGFNITGNNHRFTGCKAWFSKSHGWLFGGQRNEGSNLEAQDNTGHGFLLDGGSSTFSNLCADSNSYKSDGTGVGLFDGIRISGFNQTLTGFVAFDKNEGNRGYRQRAGLAIETNTSGVLSIIGGVLMGNGAATGTASTTPNASASAQLLIQNSTGTTTTLNTKDVLQVVCEGGAGARYNFTQFPATG